MMKSHLKGLYEPMDTNVCGSFEMLNQVRIMIKRNSRIVARCALHRLVKVKIPAAAMIAIDRPFGLRICARTTQRYPES